MNSDCIYIAINLEAMWREGEGVEAETDLFTLQVILEAAIITTLCSTHVCTLYTEPLPTS